MCLICQETTAVIKIYSLKWHYAMKHRNSGKTFPQNSEGRTTQINNWNHHFKLQAGFLSHLWHKNKKQQSAHLEWCGFWASIRSHFQMQMVLYVYIKKSPLNPLLIYLFWIHDRGHVLFYSTIYFNSCQIEITFYFSSYFCCCFCLFWIL